MQANALMLLIESNNRALDDCSENITDWEFLRDIVSFDKTLKCISCFMKVRCLNWIFTWVMQDKVALAYDILVNYIEAHEEALNLFATFVEHPEYVDKI